MVIKKEFNTLVDFYQCTEKSDQWLQNWVNEERRSLRLQSPYKANDLFFFLNSFIQMMGIRGIYTWQLFDEQLIIIFVKFLQIICALNA